MATIVNTVVPSVVLLLAVLFSGCFSANPGFRTAITSKGFDYGKEVWLVMLQLYYVVAASNKMVQYYIMHTLRWRSDINSLIVFSACDSGHCL